ncbi:hypothetical protein [Nocardioides alcanivorans]|uniref:hypothetical protein n=1 Tax=Nocardioides alcanivorans TaxID=2897352 RepID=UPI001F3A5A76|nr:hypothetical protein [Nocardioides alcanivorans]
MVLGWGLPLLLAVTLLGPLLLGRGYALVGDMVFVPDQPWKPRWIGADGSVPRAVPTDAVTWALGTVLPGDVVQKLLLVLTLTLAGAGAAALTAHRSTGARAVATVLAVWNPFVHERLAIGHWALLVGYAMLPWVVVGAQRLRAREAGGWRAVCWPLALAGLTSPTGGVLAAFVLLAMVVPRPRLLGPALGLALVVNLPWLLPGIVNTAATPADPFGVQAFAARADSPWGVLGSVLSLGGIWKESVAVAARDSWLLSGVGVGLSLAAFAGLVLARRRDPAVAVPLLSLVGVGLVLTLLPTVGAGERVAEWLVTTIPGGGLLRDSQKWMATGVAGALLGSGGGGRRRGPRGPGVVAPGRGRCWWPGRRFRCWCSPPRAGVSPAPWLPTPTRRSGTTSAVSWSGPVRPTVARWCCRSGSTVASTGTVGMPCWILRRGSFPAT